MEKEFFCCAILKDHMQAAGRKGLSIIPVKNLQKVDEYVFFLQSRSHDAQEEISKHTVIDQAISYCPWCGKKLSDMVELDRHFISDMAKQNQHLVEF